MGVVITMGGRGSIVRVPTRVPAKEANDAASPAADFAALLAGRGVESPRSPLAGSPDQRSPERDAARSAPTDREAPRTTNSGRRTERVARPEKPEHRGASVASERSSTRPATTGSDDHEDRVVDTGDDAAAKRTERVRRQEGESAEAERPDEPEPDSPVPAKPSAQRAVPADAAVSPTVVSPPVVSRPVGVAASESPVPTGRSLDDALGEEFVENQAGVESTAGPAAVEAEGVPSAVEPKQLAAENPAAEEAPGGPEAPEATPAAVEHADAGVEVSDDASNDRHAPLRSAASGRAVPAAPVVGPVSVPEQGAAPSQPVTSAVSEVARVSPAAVAAVAAAAGFDTNGAGSEGSGGSMPHGQGQGQAGAQNAQAAGGPTPTTTGPRLVQTASILPGSGSSAPSWVERLSERMRLTKGPERIELRLELEPRGLGQIDVRLRLDGEGVRAMIVAEHEQTRALLANQQHLLEAALAEEDVHLSSFELDVGGDQSAPGEGDRERSRVGTAAGSDAGSAGADDISETTIARAEQAPGRLSVRV